MPGVAPLVPLQFDGFAFFGAICLFIVFWFVIAILIAVWVYRDAEGRGMSGVLWLLVVLVGGLIGLIVYLIVRGSYPVRAAYPGGPPWPSPGYGTYPPSGSPPPPVGSPSPTPPGSCSRCGALLAAGAVFCSNCGAKVEPPKA